MNTKGITSNSIMEKIEYIKKIEVQKSNKTFTQFINKKENVTLKNYLYELGKEWFDFKPTNCSSCLYDNYIRVLIKIKDMSTQKQKGRPKTKMIEKEVANINEEYETVEAELIIPCKYELKSGAILMDNDNSKICTKHNLTNELAKYHLEKNPQCINKFSKIPN